MEVGAMTTMEMATTSIDATALEEALRAAYALEARGFQFRTRDGQSLEVSPGDALTPEEEDSVRRHKHALAALLFGYQDTGRAGGLRNLLTPKVA
jgi:hypothetical protein